MLSPPTFSDEEQTRLARLLYWILSVLAAVNILIAVLIVISAPEVIPNLRFSELLVFFLVLSFGLLRYGKVRAASLLTMLSQWGILTYYVASNGGLRLPAFNIMYLVVVMGAMLLGTSGAVLMGVLCALSGIVIYWGETAGWLSVPTESPSLVRIFDMQMAVIFGFTALLSISARSIQNALTRARKDERELAKINQQLRDEIIEREQAQREKSKLSAIVEITSDFVGVADPQGKTLYVNTAGRQLMEFPDDEDIIGKPLSEYHPPVVAEMISKVAIPAALARGLWSGETILLTRSGREIPVSQVVIVHRELEGEVAYFSTVIRDLSEHKEAEKSRLELALQNERVELFKEFIGNISHDLRTPLTVINTSLYLLERAENPQQRREKMDNIREQTVRLDRLIQDLLTLSRLDQAPQFTLMPMGLNRVLTDVKNHITPTAENKQLTLRFDLDNAIPPILADEQELYRALANLVENAVNYTPEGGSVTIQTDMVQDKVVTRIKDTGIGIPAGELPHIFERFYRANGARKIRAHGTGLGLAIVKRIIEMHHGTIDVESHVGAGTTFSVALPMATSSESAHIN
jgi:PAS domain S-box-containing protein